MMPLTITIEKLIKRAYIPKPDSCFRQYHPHTQETPTGSRVQLFQFSIHRIEKFILFPTYGIIGDIIIYPVKFGLLPQNMVIGFFSILPKQCSWFLAQMVTE
jgi:hypothetical protein